MNTPKHYTATLDPETSTWFFTTAFGRGISGFKHQGTCQRLADAAKRDDQADHAGVGPKQARADLVAMNDLRTKAP